MDYQVAISIQSLQSTGTNTMSNMSSRFGVDVINRGLNQGFLTESGGMVFLTAKGVGLTRPMESNNSCGGDMICS